MLGLKLNHVSKGAPGIHLYKLTNIELLNWYIMDRYKTVWTKSI